MAEMVISDSLLAALRKVDTPTVCNAIEFAQGKRGFDRFTHGTMQHSRPGAPPMVGFARTATISGAAPAKESADVLRARRMDYYRYMSTGLGPIVAVIQDLDYPHAVGAWWGEVNVAVHRGLGLAGAVTNGVMRDLDVVGTDFPVLAGSVGVSHGFVHILETNIAVEVMGMRVEHGELIHADRHGALVIPSADLSGLEAAIDSVVASESIVLGAANSPDFSIEELETAWAAFEAARV